MIEVTVLFVLIHYYTKFVELQRDVVRELAILRAEVDRVAPNGQAGKLGDDSRAAAGGGTTASS